MYKTTFGWSFGCSFGWYFGCIAVITYLENKLFKQNMVDDDKESTRYKSCLRKL